MTVTPTAGAADNQTLLNSISGLQTLVVYAQEEESVAPVTEAQTSAPAPTTEAQTQAPATEAQTSAPAPATEAQTQAPATEAQTSAPAPTTEAQTQAPATEEQTQAPATEAQTQTPTETLSETLPTEAQSSAETSGTQDAEQSSEREQTDAEQVPSETLPEAGTEQSDAETEKEKKKETDKKETKESETKQSETSKYKSNAELIAHQTIVVPPDIKLEFRFTQIGKRYAVVSNREGTSVYAKKSEDAKVVGELDYYGSCYILEDKGDGWYYIESGDVRGFVKAEDLAIDEVAERIFHVKGIEELPEAQTLVSSTENEAFDYTHTTVQEVIAEKQYALASGEVKIYEQSRTDAAVIGVLSDQALCYILADGDQDWVFVESGDARGFVEKSSLITGAAAENAVSETGEANMTTAQVLVEPEDNEACYYTLTSVQAASQEAKTREAMVNFALQFVGNPYVWGGTSLTGGADCSGFVQSIYAYFGYSLPRVAEAQAGYGMQIPISSAQPGDLIFYAKNGSVYHVSMYIGNGQVVQAANSRVGIITSGIGSDAVWATRVIGN
jgi:cell wall-associated NlpC family hydrolase